MSRLHLRIVQTICCVLLLAASAHGANLTVKSAGGGNFTTIQACATAMAPGDTCTVFAGTYNEKVTVPAGTAGNYKSITVNGSDVVTVLGFTLNSHTKLIGNCTAPAAINSCGFNIQNTSSPSSGSCVAMPTSTTDVYIRNNVMYACGSGAMIQAGYPESVTYIYVQGNTLSYACITQAQAGTSTKECDGIYLEGNHILVENNDVSHYTLGIYTSVSHGLFRNNTMHDQFETEAGGNSHTDWWFTEPGVPTFPAQFNVLEGNLQYNAHGPNAKGILAQDDSPSACGSTNCSNLIIRFNTASRVGGANGDLTSGSDFPYIKSYNNTWVDSDEEEDLSTGGGGIIDNALNSTHVSFLNNIYYLSAAQNSGPAWINMYACGSSCTSGYSDYWCVATCNHVAGHTYGTGNWSDDPGNKNANPLFVNYISAGNPSNDYHLQSGSPMINAGTFLTTVAATDTGSGTSLVVNDAAYFQDGYGLSNAYSTVNGDCIAVGTASNHVCITAVNYTTNTLTLASSVSRSAGQGVYLYSKSDGVQVLTGSAPNIGAFGTAGAAPPVTITPSPVAFPKQAITQSGPPLTVAVSNTGSATLTLNTPYFTITGINAADFSNTGTGTCTNGGSVLAGNSCTVLLVFTPSVEGAETATLNISGNANGSATISGTGVPAPPTGLAVIVN